MCYLTDNPTARGSGGQRRAGETRGKVCARGARNSHQEGVIKTQRLMLSGEVIITGDYIIRSADAVLTALYP
jgi:hypothetical protein